MFNDNQVLDIINRQKYFLNKDINDNEKLIQNIVSNSKFLVIGGAGTIGQAVVKEIFSRDPKVLDVVDINENNLVEVVRDLRSSIGYISGEFSTYTIDCGSFEFERFFLKRDYDYVLNLSALKHVRSEKDPFTLMRMVDVNILNNLKLISLLEMKKVKNYFCVSTDKASNPVNMMGASKRIMEIFLMIKSAQQKITMARFANVAFSEGSLLFGFRNRIEKKQPISAPKDIKRYFITPKEAGEFCLLSCLLGKNRDIFFPKVEGNLYPVSFSEIAKNFLYKKKLKPFICEDENEARLQIKKLNLDINWPCYFFKTDTTGEKDIEEFYTSDEIPITNRFNAIGVLENDIINNRDIIDNFIDNINNLKKSGEWSKDDILSQFFTIIPNFYHKETNKYLDQRM